MGTLQDLLQGMKHVIFNTSRDLLTPVLPEMEFEEGDFLFHCLITNILLQRSQQILTGFDDCNTGRPISLASDNILSRLTTITNARDLASASARIKPGEVLRLALVGAQCDEMGAHRVLSYSGRKS